MKKYIEQIKNATNKEELHKISYDFFINTDIKITDNNLIDKLCVYKECLLDNASKEELNQCIKFLKIPKNIIKDFN